MINININKAAVTGWRRRSPQSGLPKVGRGLKLKCFVLGCFVLFRLVGYFRACPILACSRGRSRASFRP